MILKQLNIDSNHSICNKTFPRLTLDAEAQETGG